MPLDQTNWKPETETKPDLSKPSLEGLSWLLRHLPADHKWDFEIVGGPNRNGCGSAGCAIGLFDVAWPSCTDMCAALEIDIIIASKFFGRSAYGVADKRVTPQMVADRIDEFLRSRTTDARLAETRK